MEMDRTGQVWGVSTLVGEPIGPIVGEGVQEIEDTS